jgi:ubiquinone/menaquinone biosynthesis C-methylase UbiE
MAQPKGYVDPEYLRVVGDYLGQLKQRTYAAMQIETGHRVLDVGCGPGSDTLPLAQLVGATGQVRGVDYDEAMVAEAERRAEQEGVGGWVHHRTADATALPFETGYFDSCRSERLFQHLLEPGRALAEMGRVTKRDGWVVVLDTDWGSSAVDTSEVDIERRLMRFHTEQGHHNGYAGRQLYRLFKQQGFTDITFEVFAVPVTNYPLVRRMWGFERLEQDALAAKVITEAELQRWQASLAQADADGAFFGYACLVLVAGRNGGYQ